jgi:hypothetical protein
MGDTDELAHTGVEAGAGGLGGKARQIHVVRGENLSRQPASAAAAILPYILQDIGHLQALREGHGEAGKLRAILRNVRRVLAEQLGQHVADDPGHVIAIFVQICAAGQALQTRCRLKAGHPIAHQIDASLDRRALRRRQRGGDVQHPVHVHDEVALGFEGAAGKAFFDVAGECRDVAAAAHDPFEALEERERLRGREGRLVLDSVRNATQQIGIRHRHLQSRRELRNSQREGSRDVGKDLVLITFVGNAGMHKSSISESQRNDTCGQ